MYNFANNPKIMLCPTINYVPIVHIYFITGNQKNANQSISMKKKWGKKTNDNYIIAVSNNLNLIRYFSLNLKIV